MNRPRRPSPGPSTDQVLASIDATVQQRCACGCGTQLDPHGASMWFATEGCQSLWKRRRATNPDQVLGPIPPMLTPGPVLSPLEAAAVAQRFLDQVTPEPDAPGVDLYLLLSAAEMLHELTAGFSSLMQLPPPPPPTRPDPAPIIAIGLSGEGWQPASAGPLPWRRLCDGCQQYTEPLEQQYIPDIHRIAALYDVSADLLSFSTQPPPPTTALCDACRNCRQPWPGPKMLPQWRYRAQAHRHELRLAAADIWVAVGIAREVVDDFDQLQLREYVWMALERAVMDRLRWRDPCGINGCTEFARTEFALIAIPGMPARLKVCPRHKGDLMRSRAFRFQAAVW